MNNYLEQGIQVYVRIRPIASDQQDQRRSVVLSQSQDNTIVVEANNKKEYFSFDYIASENTHQQELFEKVGEPVVGETLKGYNCCVFSYGQTGAGKTYSILGNPTELVQDPFSDQRGILPRMLQEMFSRINNPCNGFQSVTVNCSYLEIYNEQIIDLMTKQSKNLAIRQDIRRGVFVEGLTQLPITSYEDVLNIIIKGLSVRKTAATFMNSESSRSHTIFTMMLNMQFEEEDTKKSLKSKIHVIDLAGSERTKLTKVQGERLKEGCNINKSLLTLSNVICSLADAGKKKKYIPFRDSKLTFFLKDSLGGNSKTKLLANISPKIAYFGDTISTLMFAKRAKIIKTKVEPNQNIADNFESLRTEIRKLREELAQTKFIKPPPPSNVNMRVMSPLQNKLQYNNMYNSREGFLPTESNLEVDYSNSQFQQKFKVFEENEMAYRLIIQNNFQRIQDNQRLSNVSIGNLKSLFEEKKRLQKTVTYQQKLLNNFPPFTKLFLQNIDLEKKNKEIQSILEEVIQETKQKTTEIETLQNTIMILNAEIQNLHDNEDRKQKDLISSRYIKRDVNSPPHHQSASSKRNSSTQIEKRMPQLVLNKRRRKTSLAFTHRNGFKDIVDRQNSIIDQYQIMIEDMKTSFEESLSTLRVSYHTLQQMYQEEQRQKHEIRKHKRKQPQVQALSNQNQYLKLNIMQLQTEIKKLEQDLFKKEVEVKTIKESNVRLEIKLENMEKISYENGVRQSELQGMIDKLRLIKQQAEKAELQMNEEWQKDCIEINQLNTKLSKMMKENYALLSKNQALTQQNCVFKGRLSELTSIDQSVIQFKEGMECTTTLDIDEDFTFEKTLHEDIVKNLQKLTIEKQRLNRQLQEYQKQTADQQCILEKASSKILSLTRDVTFYKDQSTHYAEETKTVLEQLEGLRKDKSKCEQKAKFLQVQFTRVRKDMEKNQSVSNYIRNQFSLEPLEFIEEARHLKERNSLLNDQNKKLRETMIEIEKKSNMMKNSKSMTSLTFLPIQKQISSGLQKIIYQKHQKQIASVPNSHREVDLTFRKKEQPKKLTNIMEKEKSSLQFKMKTFGQQGKPLKKGK